MPVFEIRAPMPSPGAEPLRKLSTVVTNLLGLQAGHCWVLWDQLDPETAWRPEYSAGSTAPVAFMTCKETYSTAEVGRVLEAVASELARLCRCEADQVYIAVRRVRRGELRVRGNIWERKD